MPSERNIKEKVRLHIRNKNREKYDLGALSTSTPDLKHFIIPNKFGVESIDFSDPIAVKSLNKAILHYYYGIKYWEFPDGNLCPPIPGRADYLHYIADLLAKSNFGNIPKGNKVTCLDIGLGASCIYPIIGVTEYDWSFVGSDIDSKSIASAQNIIDSNLQLKDKIECRLQENPNGILNGIIRPQDTFDAVICNPPFHSSVEEAQKGSRRKIKNLSGKKMKTPTLNFSGVGNELISEGGEYAFIHALIKESESFSTNCHWFSTLVSKESNVKGIQQSLEKMKAKQIKIIPMGTGNKSSRIVAWTFFSVEEQNNWRETRWESDDSDTI